MVAVQLQAKQTHRQAHILRLQNIIYWNEHLMSALKQLCIRTYMHGGVMYVMKRHETS